ncbi:MAG: MBOAT family protein, partial [Saprospiraceae bacterium]|nr:MBOAT family protein [Saprospiraceae bacterium]
MLFYSAEFISLFLLISFSYFFLPYRFRWVLLLVASYLFYMYFNWLYMFLIFSSTFIDYWTSIRIGKTDRRRVRLFFLLVSITFNLGLLFFFKYFNFFSQELAAVLGFFEIRWEAPAHRFLLPLGISFYTFQTMSYTIDVYRGHIKPEHHLGKFALYVSFFPQLIAGPIERAKGLLAQF